MIFCAFQAVEPQTANSTSNHPVYENLPPVNSSKPWSSVLPSNPSSAPSSRRSSSLHLMGPRPFVPFHLQSHTPSPVTHVESPVTVSTNSSSFHQPSRDGVVKATRIIVQPPFNDEANHVNRAVAGSAHSSTGMFNVKRTPRGRYMTISSSEPVRLETSLITPTSPNTAAGDLITNRVSPPHWYYRQWGLTQTDGPRDNCLACQSTGLDLLVFLYMLSRLNVQTMLALNI